LERTESFQSQINELRRELERNQARHRLLRARVTELNARVRAMEMFSHAEERDRFIDYVRLFMKTDNKC
jgi:hypothetical protein